MKLLRYIIGVVFFGMLSLLPAYADSAAQYQIDFPVPSQSQSDWQQAVPKAFAQLLGNLTSNPNIANSPKVKKQLSQAQNFVQSYSYTTQTGANGSPALLLHIQFDPQGVKQLLDQMDVQFQPATHTQTLVLLATQVGSQRQLVGENGNATTLQTTLQNLAKQRNIPLVWPVLDLQDLQNINADQVWSLNAQSTTKIAARYGSNNILEGWLAPAADGTWHSGWVLVANGKTQQWSFSGKTPDDVFGLLLNRVASATVNVNKAPTAAGSQTLMLRISNVNGLTDYQAVVKYLRSLAPVTAVDVASVESADLIVNVTLSGDVNTLNDALSGSDALQVMPAAPGDSTSNMLEYRWNSKSDVPPAVVPENNTSAPDQAIEP